MASEDIFTTADPVTARDLVYQVFAGGGCEVRPTGDFSAEVERGSATATVLFGALAGKNRQHLKYDIQVFANPQGGSIVRIIKGNVGAWAGAVGVSRANHAYVEWAQRVTAALPH